MKVLFKFKQRRRLASTIMHRLDLGSSEYHCSEYEQKGYFWKGYSGSGRKACRVHKNQTLPLYWTCNLPLLCDILLFVFLVSDAHLEIHEIWSNMLDTFSLSSTSSPEMGVLQELMRKGSVSWKYTNQQKSGNVSSLLANSIPKIFNGIQ